MTVATATFNLSQQQQDILLRGLRFVKSAVALDPLIPSPQVDQDRSRQYQEIAELENWLKRSAGR